MKNHWINRKKYATLAETVLGNLDKHGLQLTDTEKLDYVKNMVDIAMDDAYIGSKMAHYALIRHACQNKKSGSSIWKAPTISS